MNTVLVDTQLANFYSMHNNQLTRHLLGEAFQDSSKHNQPGLSLKPETSDSDATGKDQIQQQIAGGTEMPLYAT